MKKKPFIIHMLFYILQFTESYANDLQKSLPRIPKLKNKEQYVEIGRQLAYLHLNYETVPKYEGLTINKEQKNPSYKVEAMKHPKIRNEQGKSVNDKTKIIFNKEVTISDIPEQAYKYVVNGKSAIEWIMDQYKVKHDNKSGIIDDPNEFSEDSKYIFNLLLSIINVSMKTLELIDELPEFKVID